ncbi:Hypothetical_protein [Hexamita inflata]|uniref:Hypothetical_protein n=1 Tax=Hexamita inflata TaxID=28002 RepID=A0AA86QK82_9EUKA|nr:Hypothetical protein HINF_LOCUS45236 [Hexamita inflata]
MVWRVLSATVWTLCWDQVFLFFDEPGVGQVTESFVRKLSSIVLKGIRYTRCYFIVGAELILVVDSILSNLKYMIIEDIIRITIQQPIEKILFQQNKQNNSHASQSDSYTFTLRWAKTEEERVKKPIHLQGKYIEYYHQEFCQMIQ